MRIWNREKWEISYWARKIPVTARVSRLDLLSHLPVYLGPGFLGKYKQFIVKHRALSYPPTPYFNNHEGLPAIFKEAGADWRSAGCSMCLGMNPDKLKPGERAASTSNRNFEGRQGPGGRTHLVSPLVAAATAITGHLSTPDEIK